MPPAPLSKSSELTDRLSSIANASVSDDFAVRRLEAEAKKLMDTDAAGAHTVLGGVAALRGDAGEARRRHKVAISLGAPFAHYNYAFSLDYLGESDEAFEVVRDGWRKTPDDVIVLQLLIRLAIRTAHFREAREFCEHWRTLSPQQSIPLAPVIADLVAAVERGEFQEENAREVLGMAVTIERDAGIRCPEVDIVAAYSEPGSFLYKRYVLASPRDAGALNEELAGRMAESPVLMDDPGFRFVPMFIGTLVNGRHAAVSA